MSRDYVETKIKQALRLHGGNEAKAKRQVHAWLYEDHKFLLELSQPHLDGIIAYSVSRIKDKMLRPKEAEQVAVLAEKVQSTQGAKAQNKEKEFGEKILRSFVSERAAQFGYESNAAPMRRKVASQDHVDTMHLLAAASKKKDDKEG